MQARMAHPTNETFKLMVGSESLDNCSIVSSGVTNTRTLFGPYHPGLRRETVRQMPEGVVLQYSDIPCDFIECTILLL